MPKTHHIVRSFNAGEWSPKLGSRDDQDKYHFACRTLENFVPLIHGGAERRPGTEYIAGCVSDSAKSRLVPFEHSVDDTYVLEFANQTIRVFKSGAPVYMKYGTEDLSGVGTPIAHWKMDDNLATQNVVDEEATHNGTSDTDNTEDFSVADAEGNANSALDINADSDRVITVSDHNELSFGDGTTDSPFSVIGWVEFDDTNNIQYLFSKFNSAAGREEYRIWIQASQLKFNIYDDSATGYVQTIMTNTISTGWHFVGFTYSGKVDADASTQDVSTKAGIRFYVDFVEVPATIVFITNYTAMENLTSDLEIGANGTGSSRWLGAIDNISLWDKELTPAEIASLTGNDQTTVVSVTTPYLTADLFDLKFEHSADVIYITHPDYEPRKLSRYGDASWKLEVLDLQEGPFLDENTNVVKTITPSATNGSITLTATGHAPFISGTTAGHLPSGSTNTSKSQTGALFKIIQPLATASYYAELTDNYTDSQVENTSWLDCGTVAKGVTWYLTSLGTWTGTLEVQRNYTIGAAHDNANWETVFSFKGTDDRNASTNSTESVDEADYRCILTTSGDAAENCEVYFRISDTDHVGIVEITAVTDSQTATATVLKTLADTGATHRWAEGTFSNYRGWPIDVTISAEERLTFTGSSTYPLTVWGSEVGNFTNFLLGTDDSDPISFTLVGTGQQNRIRWVIPKTALIIGTVGGVHLLGASNEEEALTPSNVKAKLQTTKGSENVAAELINQAVLYAERGGKKVRELLYDYESDSHKADDLTVFADHIMGTATTDGIVQMAYQRTPEPMLWCVRNDGQIAVLSYERDQNVYSWARFTTSDSTGDSSFESIAIIYGGTRSEDEVWVTVKRTINGSTKRFIERFKPRNWGSDDEDAFFVDCGKTYDSTSTTSITGLDHLEGEEVQVFADGLKQTAKTVSSGSITIETAASVVQTGLSYTSTLKPMKLSIQGLGRTAKYLITGGYLSLYKTMRGEWGQDTSNMNPLYFREAGQTSAEFTVYTGDLPMEFEGEFAEHGDIVIRQTDPCPMTVLSLHLNVGVNTE